MKSEKRQSNSKYPYLGIYNGYVVMFTKPKSGFYVYIPENAQLEEDKEPVSLGYYTEVLAEESFSRFNGFVTLSN